MTTTKEIYTPSTVVWDEINVNIERCWLVIELIKLDDTCHQQESFNHAQAYKKLKLTIADGAQTRGNVTFVGDFEAIVHHFSKP